MQISLIMLIGLLAKTAILLTEYASARRKEGLGLVAAAISAAKALFRPIIMTSDTMVFGMLPLMFASGVGANGNISVGTGTVGGLLFGTLALFVYRPYAFRHIPISARKDNAQEKTSYQRSLKVSECRLSSLKLFLQFFINFQAV